MRILGILLQSFPGGACPWTPLEGVVPSALQLMQFVTSQHLNPPFHPPPPDFVEPSLIGSPIRPESIAICFLFSSPEKFFSKFSKVFIDIQILSPIYNEFFHVRPTNKFFVRKNFVAHITANKSDNNRRGSDFFIGSFLS